MPETITSFMCEQCQKLFPSNGRYLLVTALDSNCVAADDDDKWRNEPQPKLQLKDKAFCNSECFAEYVHAGLTLRD